MGLPKMSSSPASASTSDPPDTPTNIRSLESHFCGLALCQGLKDGSRGYRKARNNFIVGQWELYFGEETVLGNWQKLCHDVGIGDDINLSSIRKCRKALKGVWVNIWDLLDAQRRGTLPVRVFPSKNQLVKYTLAQGKIFPKQNAKEGGPVSALMVQIYHRQTPSYSEFKFGFGPLRALSL